MDEKYDICLTCSLWPCHGSGGLFDGLSPRRPGFYPGSVHVGFVVDKVALGQVLPLVLRFSPVILFPPVLQLYGKQKKLNIFTTGLHNKPQGCGASVASAAGPFTTSKNCVILWRNTHFVWATGFDSETYRYRMTRAAQGCRQRSRSIWHLSYARPHCAAPDAAGVIFLANYVTVPQTLCLQRHCGLTRTHKLNYKLPVIRTEL
jgi:hypothetical protein